MKSPVYLMIIVLTMTGLGTGCSQEPGDPVFEYNLKSATIIETNNDFGLKLFRNVIAEENQPNIMISPASVSIALGMAYNGAENSTRDAFEEILNYQGLTRMEINEITRELINVLVTNSSGNVVEIANSIWYDQGFPVEQEFIDLNSTYYDAEVREIDFRKAQAVKTINDWVSGKTNGKIDEIIEAIDPDMMMILINAIYFNCLWDVEFKPGDTRDAPFFTEMGTLFRQVEMMHLESNFNTLHTEGFSAVELPYKKGKFSMFLFLPGEGSSVDSLAGELDGDSWKALSEAFTERKNFTVEMPRFKFEFERSLLDDLRAMGLGIAFTDGADFSGISPVELLISDVIHKTYIDVNEKGTEAAAVTGVIMETTSLGPPSFIRLDRPFLFAIAEKSSRSILFIGKVTEPSYEN